MRVDPDGNLVFADTTLSRIRVVAATSGTFYGRAMKARRIYTVAGDDARIRRRRRARAPRPSSIFRAAWRWTQPGTWPSPTAANGVIRLVAAHSGTFYGQAMTTGDIYTIGGVPGDDGHRSLLRRRSARPFAPSWRPGRHRPRTRPATC